MTAMKEGQAKRPELFTKRVVNHTGPDTYVYFFGPICHKRYGKMIFIFLSFKIINMMLFEV